jgi:hypothetical protein
MIKRTIDRTWLDNEPNKEELEELLIKSEKVLAILSKVCYNRIRECEKSRSKSVKYDDAAWQYRQADLNGYIRAMREIAELTDLIRGNTNDR